MPALKLDSDGGELTYTDSGVPRSATDAPYITVFVVHGIIFNNLIFKRLQAIAHTANLRIVAINRRGFGGSTPVSEHSAKLLSTGTDAEKLKVSDELCNEIGYFVDAFVQKEDIPPISSDRQGGGLAILGWSAGTGYVTRAIANISSYPPETRARLARYVRALIIEDPPSLALGYSLPAETWTHNQILSIPEQQREQLGLQWLTAYFDHGDLSTRDKSPRAPTIYNMSAEERTAMIEPVKELPIMLGMFPSALSAFRKACFDSDVRSLLPEMKVWHLGCDAAPSFGIAAYFDILADHEANGGGLINFRMIPGGNHFPHWDDPEKTLQALVEAVQ
ncbi:Alpha/Beta hydrolase protein [Fomitopsis serialis]|uniref:Alpha/Beta hydrolase protein n=1 Tax=Fomitopsis serialis TaxID=139415 RepID=UPI002008ABB0|nr:Alpha/Beta hydrolase protein [Neoantrodia serialis]KAH9931957.1 Alpha/Beta hydrolase protein [Neoantrodia serialis]